MEFETSLLGASRYTVEAGKSPSTKQQSPINLKNIPKREGSQSELHLFLPRGYPHDIIWTRRTGE